MMVDVSKMIYSSSKVEINDNETKTFIVKPIGITDKGVKLIYENVGSFILGTTRIGLIVFNNNLNGIFSFLVSIPVSVTTALLITKIFPKFMSSSWLELLY